MKTPPIGHTARFDVTVDRTQTIALGASDQTDVFSTPSMINMMEHAAREALRPFLTEEEESVGVDVHVQHTAATPVGHDVWADATITAVQKNVIDFNVAAFDSQGPIGQGTHRRAVVPMARLAEKLSEKDKTLSTSRQEHLPAFRTLLVETDGPLMVVTLDRPGKKNAINQEMTSELELLTAWLAGHPELRVVIITGSDGSFSAGDDISDLDLSDIGAAKALSRRRGNLYERWAQLPQVLIATIVGSALGGGCVCASSCDFRIAAHNAKIGLPEIRLGWPPNYGTSRLVALVGRSRAVELALTGKILTAREAEACGLVQQLVAEAHIQTAAHQLAHQLLALPRSALVEAKRLLSSSSGGSQLNHEASEAFGRCLATPDAHEGIQAFLEKRAPRFNR